MTDHREAVSPHIVLLPRAELARMIRLVRALDRLSRLPAYRDRVIPEVPETARFDPGHDSVMMGYDFHLTGEGAKLIEVNTNAGGALLSYLAHFPGTPLLASGLPHRLKAQLLRSFADEMGGFAGARPARPQCIAIVDENPREQFLYSEMLAFADLFADWGAAAVVADPAELEAGPGGVSLGGQRADLVYNRHCDFYLESDAMAGLRAAYLGRAVCLTPNPFTYGLLADKRRMILWSSPEELRTLGLRQRDAELFASLVPRSRLLSALDPEEVWQERKALVFKPVSRFGSRGVLLGRKISRSRFNTLVPEETLVQALAEPSLTEQGPEGPMKTDFRLYAYRNRILGVAARLYRGQVTNMRTPGGGFAPVRVV
ncbi:MAG: hypothetical protein C0617_06400 [Desulfuromonas sp.]|uniref:hypothetical protein n=1 Tax=Desulfuromonas sp. TaxID=892 RepID=UPI000CC707A0|nr:hypothetical protein [Desulfuromonas sp.]PLX84838.1 MAG: hypothetical protein C0617_06400 [Desulfuromonas sp.]